MTAIRNEFVKNFKYGDADLQQLIIFSGLDCFLPTALISLRPKPCNIKAIESTSHNSTDSFITTYIRLTLHPRFESSVIVVTVMIMVSCRQENVVKSDQSPDYKSLFA
jgi:hypothetical protein